MRVTSQKDKQLAKEARKEYPELRSVPDNDFLVGGRLPSAAELGTNGVLQFCGLVNGYAVWCFKKGGHIVSVILTVWDVYDLAQFCSECVVPGSLPDQKQIAMRVHEILTASLVEIVPVNEEPPRYVASNTYWDAAKISEIRAAAQHPHPDPLILLQPKTTLVASTGVQPVVLERGFNFPVPWGTT